MQEVKPKVSIIIPSFNESERILEQSFASLVSQSFGDFECLVIDESTDLFIAKSCKRLCEQDKRFSYIHPEKRIGLAASLNLGISKAKGDLIARFDADDLCMPNRLELQVSFMDSYPDIDILGGGLEIMNEEGKTLAFRQYPSDHSRIERRLLTTTAIAHPTVMMRKNIIDRFGGYDSSFRFSEDLDLWLRLINRGVKFANLSEVLVRYRQQTTHRNPLHWRFNLRARTKNMSMRHLPLRVFGICAIAVWGSLPGSIQKRIYSYMLLRNY